MTGYDRMNYIKSGYEQCLRYTSYRSVSRPMEKQPISNTIFTKETSQ